MPTQPDPTAVPDDAERPDVSHLGYEAARDELTDIVARLESGQVGLEESLALWQRGEALAAHCAGWLDRAEARVSGTDRDSGAHDRG